MFKVSVASEQIKFLLCFFFSFFSEFFKKCIDMYI